MYAIATALGYQSLLLKTAHATRDRVRHEITAAATELSPGDIFLLTYAGHGNTWKDDKSDEDDGFDESWCLYDGEIIDDELGALWRQFQRGVRVVVISDSCHSGTITRDIGGSPLGTDTITGVERAMPGDVSAALRRAQRSVYRERKADARSQSNDAIASTVLSISGCRDDEKSREIDGHGVFTRALMKVWDDGHFSGDYKSLREQIVMQMPANQTPQLNVIGDMMLDLSAQPALRPEV